MKALELMAAELDRARCPRHVMQVPSWEEKAMEERTYKKKKRGESDREEGKIHSLLTIMSPGTTLRVIHSMHKVRKGKKISMRAVTCRPKEKGQCRLPRQPMNFERQ
jgi:hypoxanthine-guanine phosphoribosyltransferase